MLSAAYPGGGGVFDGRALPPQIAAAYSQNLATIRLDSDDPDQKRIQDELVVRQAMIDRFCVVGWLIDCTRQLLDIYMLFSLRALNYHGQQLTSFMKDTEVCRLLDLKNVDYHLYQQVVKKHCFIR